ncbi:MAG: 3-deoxy-manno-octulosonate cytidylyltransferase [Fibrobacter sp.]|nr:3-deoxy-manno-octulosonate cytidylyltransferase [Fibrobacter sp.]
MAIDCIIPARMGSTRFPGKPLVKLLGKEMIRWTMEGAIKAQCFDRVVCATDSAEIADVVTRAGFEFVMTGPCFTGSDRVAEAAKALHSDLVVNLQGDEPLICPDVLRQVALELQAHPEGWVTVASPLDPAEALLKTVVKILVKDQIALDFSREIPVADVPRWKKHQGIYAYSKESRDEFASLPQSDTEKERSLEQLRILGRRTIRVVDSSYLSLSVDVPSDVIAVEDALRKS